MRRPPLAARLGDTEPFVRRIVASGLALVAGLWLLALAPAAPLVRVVGGLVVLLGVVGLSAGIWSQFDAGGVRRPRTRNG